MKNGITTYTLLICLLFLSTNTLAIRDNRERDGSDQSSNANLAYCNAAHNVGKIALTVSNDGSFGLNAAVGGSSNDCFTGESLPSCEYPKGSNTTYLYAAGLWVGAVKDRDTLVSTGGYFANEMHPDVVGLGEMIYRSTIDPSKVSQYTGAISEQDYIAVYYDTCISCAGASLDKIDNRRHLPLGIEVTQRTFSWSYSYAEDFVLFDYSVKNISDERLHRVYMGIFVDADVHHMASQTGWDDDLCGFRQWQPADYLPDYCPEDSDQVNLAWTIDNDGDLGQTSYPPVPHIGAMRIIRTPSDSLRVSFNWWIRNRNPALEYGPQARATYRDLGTGGLGQPLGDRNRYHFMRNGEFDFDQPKIATIGPLDPIWIPPPQNRVNDWTQGLDVRYLLSFGPFEIEPGQSLPITMTYVCGENFHKTAENHQNLPDNPDAWYAGVDFSDLSLNSTWANWIYDNPGVDTDSDGYAGKMLVCNLGTDSTIRIDTIFHPDSNLIIRIDTTWEYSQADTIWREGDGVPDFRGATPPPAPKVRVEPEVGSIHLLWDGSRSETTRDIFSRELDFEGYRVHFARDDRPESYVILASYDFEDYNKYTWNKQLQYYELLDSPFSLAELRAAYGNGDSNWHPDFYPRNRPLVHPSFPDSIFYFTPQDYNRSILANDPVNANTKIKKAFPNTPKPLIPNADSIRILYPNGGDTLYLTEYGFIKYYTYEYTLTDLIPTVPHWINVTAFDYGSPSSGLPALETNPSVRPAVTYALEAVENVIKKDLKVFVYPNPYRSDANYRQRGFEGRSDQDRPVDRTRAIHFANLPPKCVISIFSIDGDLIREIEHDIDPSDPLANHDSFDLITRNSQQIVSGLYYWTVEDDSGRTQIGKLAVIM